VHPSEWAIGEAAGVIAATSIHSGEDARAVVDGPAGLAAVHELLRDRGAPIHWPEPEFEPAAAPTDHSAEQSRRDHA
jgi:hypothetical protein